MKVLIIEDNEILAKNIGKFLNFKWIHGEIEFDGKNGYKKAVINNYDVIILDLNLPEMDGMDVCEKLRLKGNNTPILMLTSRTSKKDIVEWLDMWADDYLGKPFDNDELLARLNALNRREIVQKSNIIEIDSLKIDLNNRTVSKNNKNINLSTLEFDLLSYLVKNKWKPIDRKELLEKVWWEFDAYMFSRTVDVYIGYLRKKFGKNFIQTKKWFGYIIP